MAYGCIVHRYKPRVVFGQEVCFGQAIKGTWWMPWHREAMKDAAGGDTLRGAASELRSGDVRMGKPGRGNALSSAAE